MPGLRHSNRNRSERGTDRYLEGLPQIDSNSLGAENTASSRPQSESLLAKNLRYTHRSSRGFGALRPSMRRQVGIKLILEVRGTSLFSRRVAAVAMLPSALSRSDSYRSVHVGRFSFQPELPSVWRPVVLLLQSGSYFMGEKSVGRIYVESIFSTSLLACSDLITS